MGVLRSLGCAGASTVEGRGESTSDELMNVKIAELLCRGPCCAEGSASTGWPRGHPRLLQGIRPAEAVWLGDLVRLRPPRHQLASFLKVPTSFEDEEEAASKAEEDEVPRPPDSPHEPWPCHRSG